MRKLLIFLICFFIFGENVYAYQKYEVEFVKCVDGDTANFLLDGEELKFRFLGIDTPETKHPTKGEESGGKIASDYTCDKLKKAKKIEIEYDPESDKVDKYKRHLVWVYVDGKMLQEELISKGYAVVAYIYGDYEYVQKLCDKQELAINKKLGIWADGKREVGYCENKNNKTTKKKQKTDEEKFLEYLEKGKYDRLLSEFGTSSLSFLSILVLILVVIILKRK